MRGGYEPLLRPSGRGRPILLPACGPIRGGVSLHHAKDGALSGLRQVRQLPSLPASECTPAGDTPFPCLQAHAPVLHHSGRNGMRPLFPDGHDEQRTSVQGPRRALPLPRLSLPVRFPHRRHAVPHPPGRLRGTHCHSFRDLCNGKAEDILYGRRPHADTPAGKLRTSPSCGHTGRKATEERSTTRNNRSTANSSKKTATLFPAGCSRDAGSRKAGNRLNPAESRTCRTGSLHPCPGRLLCRKPVPEHPESEWTRQFPAT